MYINSLCLHHEGSGSISGSVFFFLRGALSEIVEYCKNGILNSQLLSEEVRQNIKHKPTVTRVYMFKG